MLPVTVLSWMKNEEDILPFFLRHYSFADRIIVWDNGSTDRTRAILGAHPKVSVREWATGGEMRDLELTHMKSEEYRHTGPGWKIVVDADEFLWARDIRAVLERCERKGIRMPMTVGFDMVADTMPKDDGMTPLTSLVKFGAHSPSYSKFCLFQNSVDIRFTHGAHACKVRGKVRTGSHGYLFLLHYRWMGLDRILERGRRAVLSADNVRLGLGTEQKDEERMRRKWKRLNARKVKVLP